MSKCRSMYAGSSGAVYNTNAMQPGNGNGKWQGLVSTTNRSSRSISHVRSRAYGNNRNVVFYINQLGGVGGKSKMFASRADGLRLELEESDTEEPIETVIKVSYKINDKDLNELSQEDQKKIINDVKQNHATELGIPISMITVTLVQGSIIINLYIKSRGSEDYNEPLITKLKDYIDTAKTKVLNSVKDVSNTESLTIDESYSGMVVTSTDNSARVAAEERKAAEEQKAAATIWNQLGSDIDGENAGDQSGYSVSLSNDGTIVAIGAISNDDNGNYSGHVRVYENISGTWTKKGGDIDGDAVNDLSGWSVSLSGNGEIVAIGAIFAAAATPGSDSGHVKVYEYSGGSWSQKGGDIDGKDAGDESGHSVSLSNDGTIVAIGAPYGIDDNGNYSGHVRVYEWDPSLDSGNGDWAQKGGDIDGEAADDYSGYSVSLSSDGTIVAIGANFNDGVNGSESYSGHVRVFEWDPSLDIGNGDWAQKGGDIDGDAANDESGYSVSLSNDGTIVAIGAPFNGGNGSESYSGHVKVYEYSGGSWSQKGGDIDGDAADDQSGYSVSLSSDGTIVAIGAPFNGGNGSSSGHVKVYKNISGTWTQLGSDIDGKDAGDQSGYSVSLSNDGTIVAIGAISNDDNGNYSGHVRVYEAATTAAAEAAAAREALLVRAQAVSGYLDGVSPEAANEVQVAAAEKQKAAAEKAAEEEAARVAAEKQKAAAEKLATATTAVEAAAEAEAEKKEAEAEAEKEAETPRFEILDLTNSSVTVFDQNSVLPVNISVTFKTSQQLSILDVGGNKDGSKGFISNYIFKGNNLVKPDVWTRLYEASLQNDSDYDYRGENMSILNTADLIKKWGFDINNPSTASPLKLVFEYISENEKLYISTVYVYQIDGVFRFTYNKSDIAVAAAAATAAAATAAALTALAASAAAAEAFAAAVGTEEAAAAAAAAATAAAEAFAAEKLAAEKLAAEKAAADLQTALIKQATENPTIGNNQANDFFADGPNDSWVKVLPLTIVADGAASREPQTLKIIVTGLPDGGANYRIAKSVANGSDYLGAAKALSEGVNTINVDGVSFDRYVKVQFSSGDIEFSSVVVNGVTLDLSSVPESFSTDAASVLAERVKAINEAAAAAAAVEQAALLVRAQAVSDYLGEVSPEDANKVQVEEAEAAAAAEQAAKEGEKVPASGIITNYYPTGSRSLIVHTDAEGVKSLSGVDVGDSVQLSIYGFDSSKNQKFGEFADAADAEALRFKDVTFVVTRTQNNLIYLQPPSGFNFGGLGLTWDIYPTTDSSWSVMVS